MTTDSLATDPLFCFGTLMDSDVLTLVSGQLLHALTIELAELPGHVQREVAGENFPVLVAQAGQSTAGVLISGLTVTALDRILFFEGEEYALAPISVLVDDAPRAACYFVDTDVYTTLNAEWQLARWQAHHKAQFLERTQRYMRWFGTLNAAEADTHW